MLNKLTFKQFVISIVLFLGGYLGFVLELFLFLAVPYGAEMGIYLANRINEIVMLITAMFIFVGITYLYMYFEDKHILAVPVRVIEVFLLFYLQLAFCFAMSYLSVDARPTLFLSLMTITLIGRRESIFLTVVYAMMQFVIDRFCGYDGYICLVTIFCGGTIGIFAAQHIRTRVQILIVLLIVLIPIELIVGLLEVVGSDLSPLEIGKAFMWGGVNGTLSVLLYMSLLPLFEVIFSELTVFRLRELTSDEAKLIKRLKLEADGTYNHSVTVAQLVEACARAIGENAELARAAAYYHDVGKLKNPSMFTENIRDKHNIHDELTPELSVAIIRAHTADGAELIRKEHLPEFFADIAIQHHGTLPIRFFYAKAQELTDGDLDIKEYSYPGPRPTSKIAAIIMIADACEAASRSLKDKRPEVIEKIVRSLMEERMELEQFDDCDITFAELTIIRKVIVQQLSGVHHSRISYPKIKVTRRES